MATPEPTARVEESIAGLREGIRGASHLLVCLDFDGTLAPIVEEPGAAAMADGNRAAVEALAADPAVTTAVVTGRALTDIRQRLSLPITYAGNHGLELYREGELAVHPIARKRASLVGRVSETLEAALGPIPNYRIENKRLTGTVHVRSVPEPARERVYATVEDVVDRLAGGRLETSRGKRIVEFSPSVSWGKGEAVRLLERSAPEGTAVVYLGDDVTDESAFRELEPEDVGVYVGSGDSAASCRVESPAAVTELLAWLAGTGTSLLDEPTSVR
ncbi:MULTISPECIES: trehalose-phosphatase [Saliphagus]|uniref:Trehalose 6-phosphate phosphatase n=1 Tax=Saliphagus infecundisoli TaxID=1849069 RepID=A0ABD5QEG1_9EURY|nr:MULTISPECIES: trehalose-phosphatase [Saliphagus]